MKKITILIVAFMYSFFAFSATTYLVDNGSGTTWTVLTGPGGTVTHVDLSTVNAGSAASFNAWFADKSLATPVFSGTKFTSGDQVWITAGTYYLTGSVTLFGGVSIYGGFAGTETATSSRAKNSANKWDFTNVTALDGSVAGSPRVATYIGLTGGTSATTIIDGLTIQNCKNSATASSGGAAKINGTGTTIQNCIVTACLATGTVATGASAGVSVISGASLKDSYIHHNTASSTGTCGGGVAVYGNSSSVSGCKIEYNTNSGDGAGLYLYSSTSGVSISNCSFSNNSSTKTGGGIASYITATNASPISISNCTFTSNSAGSNGGGANLSSTVTTNAYNISNCTFTGNYSSVASGNSSNGGGGAILNTCGFTLDKCTFTSNYTTAATGGAMQITSASSCSITNSKFIGNTAGSTSTNSGSAIYAKTSYTASNCLFADNTGSTPIHFFSATAVSTFQNCTFANNLTAAGAASPIQLLNIGTAPYPQYVFANCLFYKISNFSSQTNPSITTCASDIALSTCSITNITTADFVDATNATVLSRNYQLSYNSLALNAGTNLSGATSPVTADVNAVSRPQGSAYDIGAFELPYFNTTVTFNANGTVNAYTSGDVDSKPQGSQLSFTITPNSNYGITSVTYNGVDVTGSLVSNVYVAPALAANATLSVQFDLLTGISKSYTGFQSYAANGAIELKNGTIGDDVTIFGPTGSIVKSVKMNSNNMSVAVSKGIYIVKAGKKIQKVIVQ